MYHISRNTYQEGFVALMSAIVISALLLALTFSAGFSGFFARFNLLDAEAKEQSRGLAEGCLDTAIVRSIEDSSFNPINENVAIGSKSCTIVSMSSSGTQKIIKTLAVVNKTQTNIKGVFETSSFRLSSEIECQNMSSCE